MSECKCDCHESLINCCCSNCYLEHNICKEQFDSITSVGKKDEVQVCIGSARSGGGGNGGSNQPTVQSIMDAFLKRIEKLEMQIATRLYQEVSAAMLFEKINLPDIRARIEKLENTPFNQAGLNGLVNQIRIRDDEIKSLTDKIIKLENDSIVHYRRTREIEQGIESSIIGQTEINFKDNERLETLENKYIENYAIAKDIIFDGAQLHAHVLELELSVEKLHTHKNYQIDENRKASQRMDALEIILKDVSESLENYREYRTSIEDIETDVMYLKEKTTNLEKENEMRKDTIGCIDSAYNDAFLKIEKHLNELEKHFNGDYELIASKLNPYKCPLCEGKVLTEIKIQRTESGQDKLILECHACDGKGIVWGFKTKADKGG